MFTRILVALDGSEVSLDAVRVAANLAREQGATLSILHVCPLPEIKEPFVGASAFAAPLVEQYVRDLHAAVRARLKSAFEDDRGTSAGVSYDVLVETGDPVEVIVRVADTRGHDLIVMGTRARSMDRAAALGSVSHGVLCRAHTPVLVVR